MSNESNYGTVNINIGTYQVLGNSTATSANQYSNQYPATNPQYDQYDTLRQQSIADINKFFRERKEYQKNLYDISLQNNILQKWTAMSGVTPRSLDCVFYDDREIQENIYNEIAYFKDETIFTPTCAGLIFLAAVAASTQGRISIEINEDWHEPLNIYTVQFAEASTKKSLIYNKILRPVKEFEDKNHVYIDTISDKSRSDFSKKLKREKLKELAKNIDLYNLDATIKLSRCYDEFCKKIDEELMVNSSSKRILVDMFSKTGLYKFLKENNEFCAIISAESDTFFEDIKNYNQEILRLYTRESITEDKAYRNTILNSPSACISIFAHPDKIDNLYIDEKYRKNGLVARFIPWIVNNNFVFNNNYNESIKEIYRKKIESLLNRYWNSQREWLKMDALAVNRLQDYSSSLNNSQYENQDLKSWISKLSGNVVRLAGALHVYNNFEDPCGSNITIEEIDYGIKIATNSMVHAEFLIDPLGYQAMLNAKKIIESYQRSDMHSKQMLTDPNRGVITRDISQRTRLNYKDVNNALRYLEWRNWVCLGDNGTANFKVIFHPHFYLNFNQNLYVEPDYSNIQF